jgi:hypothetical protein
MKQYYFKPTFTCDYALIESQVVLEEVRRHLSFYIASELHKLVTEKEAKRYTDAAETLWKERILEHFA